MIYLQFVALAIIIMILFKLIKTKTPVAFSTQEHFVEWKPVFYNLPKRAIKNSHWFTHTFMRSRRKG